MSKALWLSGVVILFAIPARAADPLAVGKLVHFDFPAGNRGGSGNRWYYRDFIVPIAQGDKLRFQVTAKNDAEMKFYIEVRIPGGNAGSVKAPFDKSPTKSMDLTWVPEKRFPGTQIYVRVWSDALGKAEFVVNKADGDDTQGDTKDEGIKKLQRENAQLKTENAKLKKDMEAMRLQLEDLKKLIEKKK